MNKLEDQKRTREALAYFTSPERPSGSDLLTVDLLMDIKEFLTETFIDIAKDMAKEAKQ